MTYVFVRLFSYAFKVLRALSDEAVSPNRFAWGVVVGLGLALPAYHNPHLYLFLFLLLVLKVSFRAGLLAYALFLPLSYLFAKAIDQLGAFLLELPQLTAFFETGYNSFWVLTRFNNTYALGAFAVTLLLALPLYWLAKTFVKLYRATWHEKLISSKVYRKWIKSKLFSFLAGEGADA